MEQQLDRQEIASQPKAVTTFPRYLGRLRLLRQSPTALVGTAIILFWIVVAIIGPAMVPYGVNDIEQGAVWKPPSANHLLGTDNLGRDIFSRLIVGTRQMMVLPLLSVGAAVVAGTIIGMVSGYYGGWIDEVIMRLVDVMMAFPVVMLYLMIVVAFGSSALNVILAIAVGASPGIARMVRGLVLDLRSREFIAAAKMRGETTFYILFREILPNITGPILVDALVRVGYAAFSIGALGFLGLGVPPPNPDWGRMVAEARSALLIQPTAPLAPALAIASLVIAYNLLADGLTQAAKAE